MTLYHAAAPHALDDDWARGMGRDCLWFAFSGIFVALPTSLITSIVLTMACDQVVPASESIGHGGGDGDGFVFIIRPMVVGTGCGVLGGILAEVLVGNGPLGAFLASLGASALATVVSFKQTFGVF